MELFGDRGMVVGALLAMLIVATMFV